MKPKSQETAGQFDLFNTRLADLLNPRHELYRLANLIDWQILDNEFGQFFSPEKRGSSPADPPGCRTPLLETCVCML
jgi:transposase, IS5 family